MEFALCADLLRSAALDSTLGCAVRLKQGTDSQRTPFSETRCITEETLPLLEDTDPTLAPRRGNLCETRTCLTSLRIMFSVSSGFCGMGAARCRTGTEGEFARVVRGPEPSRSEMLGASRSLNRRVAPSRRGEGDWGCVSPRYESDMRLAGGDESPFVRSSSGPSSGRR